MPTPVIKVENLSKKYTISQGRKAKYNTLRDTIAANTQSAIAKIARRSKNPSSRDFWALKDVNFEVNQGDRLGIIGHNGSGKSTLLKILSRITEPSKGRIKLRGRIASLLEVGTGFHPELTGRENVFLNGAILGMSKTEIKRKFDEIVDFAGVEEFLDLPVKRYSSGMYVRLAFAVAAHLETEILIVDEVLAVGDVQFQQKCLGKMQHAGQEGKTVLFVSHNMSIMQNLCNRGVFLQQGRVIADTTIERAIGSYFESIEQATGDNLLERQDRTGKGQMQLAQIKIFDESRTSSTLTTGSSVEFSFEITRLLPRSSCVFTIYDRFGVAISSFNSQQRSDRDAIDTSLGTKFICRLEQLPLMPGRYSLNVLIKADGVVQDRLEAAAMFRVEPGTVGGRSVVLKNNRSKICIPHVWQIPA